MSRRQPPATSHAGLSSGRPPSDPITSSSQANASSCLLRVGLPRFQARRVTDILAVRQYIHYTPGIGHGESPFQMTWTDARDSASEYSPVKSMTRSKYCTTASESRPLNPIKEAYKQPKHSSLPRDFDKFITGLPQHSEAIIILKTNMLGSDLLQHTQPR